MRFHIIKRERIKQFTASPYMFLIVVAFLFIDWSKNPIVFSFREAYTLYHTITESRKHTFIKGKDEKVSYLEYELAEGLHQQYGDTIIIRFPTKDIESISNTDYDNQKFAWDLGFVEYQKDNQWYPLHPRLNKEERFIITFSAEDRQLPKVKEEILMEVLPMNMRSDDAGNLTTIIKQWD